MRYRFILDTNIIKPKPIETLQNAGLEKVCLSGNVAFYVTPTLLKERLNFVLNNYINPSIEKSLEFLINLKWQRVFREVGGREGIYAMELEGYFPSEYLFDNSLEAIKETLMSYLQGARFDEDALREGKAQDDDWRDKKGQNKVEFVKKRQAVSREISKDKGKVKKDLEFPLYRDELFEKMAIHKITNSINSKRPKEELIDYWRKNRNRCWHFNKFVEGLLYELWYAMATTEEIDSNSYDDIEHLIYLNNVDGIISEDSKFMSSACKELFPSKDFWTVEKFANYIKSLLNN